MIGFLVGDSWGWIKNFGKSSAHASRLATPRGARLCVVDGIPLRELCVRVAALASTMQTSTRRIVYQLLTICVAIEEPHLAASARVDRVHQDPMGRGLSSMSSMN